jgi:choline monooxygenase
MMDGISGFRLEDYPLRRVRLESWDGFIFVNFDDKAASLREYLGDLPDRMACYDLSNMVTVRRKEYQVACNWKLLTENSIEEYHTATVHRGSIGAQVLTFEDGPGEWEAGHLYSEKSVATLPGEKAGFPHIPTLTGKAAEGTYFVLVYPCTTFAFAQDSLMWLELYPQSAGRTRVVIGSAFPRSTVERPDFETVVQAYYTRWDKSIPEDNWISEQQQLGLASPLSTTGRVSRFEPAVHWMANWILDRVLAK